MIPPHIRQINCWKNNKLDGAEKYFYFPTQKKYVDRCNTIYRNIEYNVYLILIIG